MVLAWSSLQREPSRASNRRVSFRWAHHCFAHTALILRRNSDLKLGAESTTEAGNASFVASSTVEAVRRPRRALTRMVTTPQARHAIAVYRFLHAHSILLKSNRRHRCSYLAAGAVACGTRRRHFAVSMDSLRKVAGK